MLRITPVQPATYRLEGRLVGPWVDELRATCRSLPPSALRLDLSAVSYVDETGVSLLDELRRLGVDLSPCSPFVTALLTTEAQ